MTAAGIHHPDTAALLAEVRRAGAAMEAARASFEREKAAAAVVIVAAVDAGLTFRQVGDAVGVSHARVHQIYQQHRGGRNR